MSTFPPALPRLDTDVLLVGLGPVGATAPASALDLRRFGHAA
jgi:hypothetical protein